MKINIAERLVHQLHEGTRPTLFVSRPNFFGVNYEINPWMKDQIGNCDREVATKQWKELVNFLRLHADVRVISSNDESTPDVTFVANAGTMLPTIDGKYTFLSAKFKHPERSAEETFFQSEMEWAGCKSISFPKAFYEGDGDCLQLKNHLVMGYGHRSDLEAAEEIKQITGLTDENVHPVKLVDDRFYHLDTCFFYHYCQGDEVCMYFPAAFDEAGQETIENLCIANHVPVIRVTEDEAKAFTCNAVGAGHKIIAHLISDRVSQLLKSRGFDAVSINLSEFHKAGGSAKCLTFRVPREALL